MALSAGAHLGPYEIINVIGVGGMGEVYRAKDPRFGREVAIKILPSSFSSDPDRLQRFEQEARAAGTLNHPAILSVHDIAAQKGLHYLVCELLEGDSLRNILQAGPIPQRKILDYAIQIAHGLSAAHEKGIVHRDLKPENLFITKDGRAKILDFGLAKLMQPETPDRSVTHLPTSPGTEPGIVLGTVGYMSPEQVRGKSADHRSDIFAFGAILHEMLTGKRTFHGDSTADTMSAILHQDPHEISGTQGVSPSLDRIVRRCLEKIPEQRFQSASDLAFALESLSTSSASTPALSTTSPRARLRERIAWMLMLIFVALLALFTFLYIRKPPESSSIVRFSINPPPDSSPDPFSQLGIAVSHDGTRIALVAVTIEGKRVLWLRSLDSLSLTLMNGTDGAMYPFWSADDKYVGFFANGKMKKVAASGGMLPEIICDAPDGRGGTWNSSGKILFTPYKNDAIYQISSGGGHPTSVTKYDAGTEYSHRWAQFLPDGKHFIYMIKPYNKTASIFLGSLESQERRELISDCSNAIYVPGYLVLWKHGNLIAQPFDAKTLRLSGDAFSIASEKVSFHKSRSLASFSVSDSGVLAYHSISANYSRLQWVDRKGTQISAACEEGYYESPSLSPDGKTIAVVRFDPNTENRDLWVCGPPYHKLSRFTFQPSQRFYIPVWSPDGAAIAFNSDQARGDGIPNEIFRKASDGSQGESSMIQFKVGATPTSWSPDNQFLLFDYDARNPYDIMMLPLTGERKPSVFLATAADEWGAHFSPDGKWVAYTSDETGNYEVYVRPFPPGSSAVWQVSTGGGREPRWRRDGKELYYLASDGNLMAVTVQTGSSFSIASAIPLFKIPQGRTYLDTDDLALYDVAADGQSFVINIPSANDTPSTITVVLNWPALLH